jgi:predicted extracellular nuclease
MNCILSLYSNWSKAGVASHIGTQGRRTDNGGIHDGAGADLQAATLQYLTYLGKQLFAELVMLKQAAKLQQRGAVRNALAAQVDPNESTQCRAVQQGFLAGYVREIEPVLHKIHP